MECSLNQTIVTVLTFQLLLFITKIVHNSIDIVEFIANCNAGSKKKLLYCLSRRLESGPVSCNLSGAECRLQTAMAH